MEGQEPMPEEGTTTDGSCLICNCVLTVADNLADIKLEVGVELLEFAQLVRPGCYDGQQQQEREPVQPLRQIAQDSLCKLLKLSATYSALLEEEFQNYSNSPPFCNQCFLLLLKVNALFEQIRSLEEEIFEYRAQVKNTLKQSYFRIVAAEIQFVHPVHGPADSSGNSFQDLDKRCSQVERIRQLIVKDLNLTNLSKVKDLPRAEWTERQSPAETDDNASNEFVSEYQEPYEDKCSSPIELIDGCRREGRRADREGLEIRLKECSVLLNKISPDEFPQSSSLAPSEPVVTKVKKPRKPYRKRKERSPEAEGGGQWRNGAKSKACRSSSGADTASAVVAARAVGSRKKYNTIALKCELCPDSGAFTTVWSKKLHLQQVHSDPTPLAHCGRCGRRFLGQAGLDLHLNNQGGDCKKEHLPPGLTVITSAEPHKFSCDTCGSKWPSIATAKTHLVKHTKEKPHVCHHCGKAYGVLRCLRYHIANVHCPPDQEHPFKCLHEGCGKVYSSKANLREHEKIHSNQLNFLCHLCDFKAVSLAKLKQHIATKCAPQKHNCPHCPSTFNTIYARRSHVLALHTAPEDMPYKCSECPKAYASKFRLRLHTTGIHSGNQRETLHCHICGQWFLAQGRFAYHLRKHGVGKPIRKKRKSQKQLERAAAAASSAKKRNEESMTGQPTNIESTTAHMQDAALDELM